MEALELEQDLLTILVDLHVNQLGYEQNCQCHAELILDNCLWFIANWACDALIISAGSNPPKTLSELSLESESIPKSYTSIVNRKSFL